MSVASSPYAYAAVNNTVKLPLYFLFRDHSTCVVCYDALVIMALVHTLLLLLWKCYSLHLSILQYFQYLIHIMLPNLIVIDQ